MSVAQKPATRAAWRFRRCTDCGTVDRASAFPIVGDYRPGWTDAGTIERRCPTCGHRGLTRHFPVVRERHTDGAA